MGTRRGIASLLLAAPAVAALIAAGPASGGGFVPKVECELAAGELIVSSNGPDPVIARRGDAIVVGDYRGDVDCAGRAASVDNVDRIKAGGGDEIELDLREGPLAPGATAEPDGSDEIEVTIAERTLIRLDGDASRVVAGEADDAVVIDLDKDRGAAEADVKVPLPTPFKAEVEIRAGGGDDRITARGRGFPFDVRQYFVALGGSGDDRVTLADGSNSFAGGGPGDDRLTGGRSGDFLIGGNGGDRIRGGRGPDFVVPGAGLDDVDCGNGRDTYGRAGGDRLRRCETR